MNNTEQSFKEQLQRTAGANFRIYQMCLELARFLDSGEIAQDGNIKFPAEDYNRLILAVMVFCRNM